MTDILGRIDNVLSCVVCGQELPEKHVSDDFCSDLCHRTWHERHNEAVQTLAPIPLPNEQVYAYQPAWVTYPLDQGVYEPLPPSEPPRASMLRDSSHLLAALGLFVAAQFTRRHR